MCPERKFRTRCRFCFFTNLFSSNTGHYFKSGWWYVFSDSGAVAPNTIGLQVGLRSYAFTSPADSNYVILRYDINNISGADVSNFYAGLFLDWDIQPNYATNQTSFDPLRDLGFAWSPGVSNSVYCGARALSGAAGFHGLINNADIDLSRSGKWSWLSGGVVTIDSIGDIHFAISSGPYTIPNGGTQTVGFALYGGKSLADVQTSADASVNQWNYIKNYTGNPQSSQLIYPPAGQIARRGPIACPATTSTSTTPPVSSPTTAPSRPLKFSMWPRLATSCKSRVFAC